MLRDQGGEWGASGVEERAKERSRSKRGWGGRGRGDKLVYDRVAGVVVVECESAQPGWLVGCVATEWCRGGVWGHRPTRLLLPASGAA